MAVRKREWTTRKGEEWMAWVADYFDQEGVRRLRTFKRKKDAEAFHAKTSVEVVEGTHVAEVATVSVKEAGQLWLQSCEADGLERGTLLQYRQHLELHINPFIGSVLLSEVSVPLVRGFQDRLREEGRSPAMIDKVTRSLGSLLVGAQERGLAKLHCFF